MAFTKEASEGKKVVLLLEGHSVRGKFGRLLAYIKLEDGRVLNEVLLEKGLAEFEGRFSHSKYQRYKDTGLRAKIDGVGMWEKVKRKAFFKKRREAKKLLNKPQDN